MQQVDKTIAGLSTAMLSRTDPYTSLMTVMRGTGAPGRCALNTDTCMNNPDPSPQ